jgi:hypothetical protein
MGVARNFHRGEQKMAKKRTTKTTTKRASKLKAAKPVVKTRQQEFGERIDRLVPRMKRGLPEHQTSVVAPAITDLKNNIAQCRPDPAPKNVANEMTARQKANAKKLAADTQRIADDIRLNTNGYWATQFKGSLWSISEGKNI